MYYFLTVCLLTTTIINTSVLLCVPRGIYIQSNLGQIMIIM